MENVAQKVVLLINVKT